MKQFFQRSRWDEGWVTINTTSHCTQVQVYKHLDINNIKFRFKLLSKLWIIRDHLVILMFKHNNNKQTTIKIFIFFFLSFQIFIIAEHSFGWLFYCDIKSHTHIHTKKKKTIIPKFTFVPLFTG